MHKHKFKLGLLSRILIAIILGIALGMVLPLPVVRVFQTFNDLFSQFLSFIIPLLIAGLIIPAIADVGRNAGRLLLITVVIAYLDTVLAALLGYGVGSWLFPDMVARTASVGTVENTVEIAPFFKLTIKPMMDVMTALVFAFTMGICIAYSNMPTLRSAFSEFREVINRVITYAIVPLLPLFIFGIFLAMTYTGTAWRIIAVFAQIIVVIFALHIFILLYEFGIAGGFTHRNPLRLLWNMMPAYMTALGTSSSAASIPVTLRQTLKNGVSDDIASFTIPLCATIHMPGSAMKITTCALAICLLNGLPHSPELFIGFILMLAVIAVAAPGVPGGVIMSSLGPLQSILGFGAEDQALMIALYIAIDSLGTAVNVTGDGAIALIIDKISGKSSKGAPAVATATADGEDSVAAE